MKCVTDWTARLEYAKVIYSGSDPKKKTEVNKLVLANAFGFSKSLHKRKEFIYKKHQITDPCDYRRYSRSSNDCLEPRHLNDHKRSFWKHQ